MRIALSVDPEITVPPMFYGGIERIVDLLARGLSKRGHEVTLFANSHSSCPVRLVPWSGTSSIYLVDTLRNSATLSGKLLAGRFDILHSFSRLAYMTPILPLAFPKLMTYQRAISPKTVRLATALSRGTLEFTAISDWMIQGVQNLGRWHIVPNGVSLEEYEFTPEVEPHAPLVFLGRVEEIKGPHLAIEIAKRSGRSLVIAGNIPTGHEKWFYERIAPHVNNKQVAYVGPVNDTQKSELLGRAAALLMPILWDEPFGIVMAEAMACGTPVLGMRRGAVPEVVDDGVTGFVADSIDELVVSVDRLKKISRFACRARVSQFYSEKAIVEGYLNVYRQLVAAVGLL